MKSIFVLSNGIEISWSDVFLFKIWPLANPSSSIKIISKFEICILLLDCTYFYDLNLDPSLDIDYITLSSTNTNWKLAGLGLTYEVVLLPDDYSYDFQFSIEDQDADQITSSPVTVYIDADEVDGWQGTATPITIDLDRSGSINYLEGSAAFSVAYEALNANVETAWITPADAFLVYDANASGGFDDYSEIALTSWGHDQQVQTDLEALDAYFNLNNDDVFDSSDSAWSDFGVWTDLNLDGVHQDGEFTTLDDAGIQSIALDYNEDSQAYITADGQAQIFGQMTVTYSDGTNGLAEDVAFAITPSEASTLDQEDNATTESILGDALSLTTGDLVDQFLESNQLRMQ